MRSSRWLAVEAPLLPLRSVRRNNATPRQGLVRTSGWKPRTWHAPCRPREFVRILIYQNPDAGHDGGCRPRSSSVCNGRAMTWRGGRQGSRLNDAVMGTSTWSSRRAAMGASGGQRVSWLAAGADRRAAAGDGEQPCVHPGCRETRSRRPDHGVRHRAVRRGHDRLGRGEGDWFFEGFGIGAFAETAAR